MKITKEQYEELCESRCFNGNEDFHELLEKIAGIETKRYTGYQYFDSVGNYLGDSSDCSVKDLLDNAYIQVGE